MERFKTITKLKFGSKKLDPIVSLEQPKTVEPISLEIDNFSGPMPEPVQLYSSIGTPITTTASLTTSLQTRITVQPQEQTVWRTSTVTLNHLQQHAAIEWTVVPGSRFFIHCYQIQRISPTAANATVRLFVSSRHMDTIYCTDSAILMRSFPTGVPLAFGNESISLTITQDSAQTTTWSILLVGEERSYGL